MAKLQNAINLRPTFEDFGIQHYVETGTGGILDSYGQNSLLQVSQLQKPDLTMHSIEILDRIHDEAAEFFKDNDRVVMHLGNSHDELPKFWISWMRILHCSSLMHTSRFISR